MLHKFYKEINIKIQYFILTFPCQILTPSKNNYDIIMIILTNYCDVLKYLL